MRVFKMKYKSGSFFHDRFILGLISGLIAGLGMTMVNYVFIYTTSAHTRYADFVGIMLFGSVPNSISEIIIATVAHIFLGGILGVVFSYLLILISSRNLIIKGIIFGTLVFLMLFSLGVIFKIPGLEKTTSITVISKGLGSMFYGLILAYSLLFIRSRVK